jgi:hypothetical protein
MFRPFAPRPFSPFHFFTLSLFQKNFVSSPSTSLNNKFANLLVPSRNHWLVSHFSPSTSLTIV